MAVRLAAFASVGTTHGGRNDSDDDPTGRHCGVLVDGEVVAVCSMFNEPSPIVAATPAWRIRGMATLPDHQSHGYGGMLLESFVDWVAANGGGLMWANLRLAAIPFYERHGFRPHGEPFATASGALHRYGDRIVSPSA